MYTQQQNKKSERRTTIITLLCLALLAAALFGRSAYMKNKAVNNVIQEAETLAQAEDFDGALKRLDSALEERPDSDKLSQKRADIQTRKVTFEVTAAIEKAESFAVQSDYEKAIAALKKCMKVYPESDRLKQKETELLERREEYEVSAALEEAESLAAQNDFEKAVTMLETCLREYPGTDSLVQKEAEILGRKTDYEITAVLTEAESLAAGSDYDGAVAALETGLSTYPNSEELTQKQTEMQGRRIDYEIETTMGEAESLAEAGDYKGAISRLDKGLTKYPGATLLQSRLGEYKSTLLETAKTKALEDAKALADAGVYENALQIIKAAQEAYGTCREFDSAYAAYSRENALIKAKAAADSGDYVGAARLIAGAQKLNANDVDLILAYNTYVDTYVAAVLAETDGFQKDNRFDEAIAAVSAGLKAFPGNEKLTSRKAELESKRPIPITSLDQLNATYWTWNKETAEDPFGNDYSYSCNYFVKTDATITPSYVEYRVYGKYSCLSGIISPHADIGERYNGVIQVYADDVLVYTSPTVTQKMDAFPFEVDISGAEYIKIVITLNGMTFSQPYGKVLIADVRLWP